MFVLIQSEAEAVEVLNCEYRYRDEWCHIRNADLTKNTINEKFTFSTTQNRKEDKAWIAFEFIGRVAHMPQNLVDEFPKLAGLGITDSDIPIVKNNLFGPQFSWIEKLNLWRNKIENIEDQAFQHLLNLVEIELHDNKIRSVTVTMFQNNPKMERIVLGGNKIKVIAPETFQNLKQLKLVNVDGNDCVDNRIGCEVMGCYEKINRTKLDSALLSCYENYRKSLDLLNEGENHS
jgi:Leucine-rich repeat (LRR) protein